MIKVQHLILFTVVISTALMLASCNESGLDTHTELELGDSVRPAVVINEGMPNTAVCDGLEHYISSNEAYLESLRNYDSYTDATRDSLAQETFLADDNLQQMKEGMTLQCLDNYRVYSVEFTREMQAILMAEMPV